ncbi:DUF4833 domain-containing protein [Corallococcus sp. AB004]|uniref:DUF4833 domain-containing protein n=1 Tax=Corallococcus TaxID=83461 RepID=UPI000EA2B383|nr:MULTISPECIES: DUF4833 domain-containing protein [Corallococcus]RKI45657.1 DUF4833 domain-containing protein [Corallococcus sp. AB004]NPC69467.1 DUF4833 domain-containing protein [Corallococcus exiguus]NPD28809.1 DUF4833 domain-containing protein [Corallococcus exiguus]NRD49806.1 DUF4833 domain-containing protein [Corallococcus exiguus]RKH95701.1 DUF4833 domain-containing protein [Corallococcus sp. AB038B]
MFPESGLFNLTAVALATVATLASAAGTPVPAQSAFFLTRSENRNQVHYALRLDEACRPVGPSPVQVYWLMLERGPSEVEELLGVEQPVYGLEDPQQVEATEDGWRIRVRLKAFPSRPVDITTARVDGKCQVQAWTKLGNTVCRLEHVFVKTSWPFSVDFVRLDGVGPDGKPVQELIRR